MANTHNDKFRTCTGVSKLILSLATFCCATNSFFRDTENTFLAKTGTHCMSSFVKMTTEFSRDRGHGNWGERELCKLSHRRQETASAKFFENYSTRKEINLDVCRFGVRFRVFHSFSLQFLSPSLNSSFPGSFSQAFSKSSTASLYLPNLNLTVALLYMATARSGSNLRASS